MQLRRSSSKPTVGAHVRYRPRLSGELRPGRSPISTSTAFACSNCPTSSPMATRPCATMYTGDSVHASAASRARKAARNGAAWRCIASADRPSAATSARSTRVAPASSRARETSSSRRPRSGRCRYSARVAAALCSCTQSCPCAAKARARASPSSARCTASRACAWASWNASCALVGTLTPWRPSAMRAAVCRRRACQELSPKVCLSAMSSSPRMRILATLRR